MWHTSVHLGRPLAFAMNCMPFGGTASVYAFSRTAMALPFVETFAALGVEFLLHDTPTSLAVRNTAARCEELLALLHEILHSDCVTARQLQSLRSRLHFAEAHMYGRVGVCMIKQMSVVDGFAQTSPLPPALRVSIQTMIHRLQHNPPVEVPML